MKFVPWLLGRSFTTKSANIPRQMLGTQINKGSGTKPDDSDHHFRTDHLNNDLAGRAARSGILTLASQAFKFLIGTGSAIVLARLLTPSDYGVVGMVAILLNFAVMFQYMGLSTATVQWPTLNHKQVSTLFWINAGLSTVITLAMAILSPVIAWFFHEPRVIAVTFGYALTIFITGLWIQHEALLNRQMRFGVLAVIDIASLLGGLTIAVAAAWQGAGYWALVYNQLASTTIRGICIWWACRWRPGLPAFGTGVRSILTFGGHFTGANLMNFFARNFDNILIGRFWGPAELGLYTRAYQLLLMPLSQVLEPIATVAMPSLARLAEFPDRYRKAYLGIIEKIAMVTMPGVVFMSVTSDWLVLLLLGPQWIASGRIFMFLGISAAVQPITRTCYWLFATQNRTLEMIRWGMIATAIAVLSICAGLPWGAVGVAASYAIADFCIYTPLLFWFIGRKGPVTAGDFYRTLFPSVCASLCSLFVLLNSWRWLESIDPMPVRLLFALLIVGLTSLLVFAALPAGRAAMQHFKELFLLIVRPKSKSDTPA